jgi:hypothetical protein
MENNSEKMATGVDAVEKFPDDICNMIERDMLTIENKLKDGFLDKDLLLLYRELKEQRDNLVLGKR